MKILIKGGIWKNTEDEIIKAAVMKYGKNQWARVASLLNRKSAMQVKARWYEWLDPSIKKTDWSRDEEEKLLHLSKLMPNQWRTIAPIVGRTAAQCMEHYEKLLDMAQDNEEKEKLEMNDPRRLRPGEIDPAPETKPARPDPIDMDDDEKEMLSEARARLMNTQGKKAKRKARERQLEEAKRISVLQKHRELKAAGIQSNILTRKRKAMDLTREIPFQKVVPAGFYDVSEENQAAKKIHLDPKTQGMEITRMEGKNHKEALEKQKIKDRSRLKTLFKANAALAISKVSNAIDPTALRRRTVLALPQPQVSDLELEDIVKMSQRDASGAMGPPIGGLSYGRSSSSTAQLVGDYSSIYQNRTANNTPLTRTPMQEDVIMQEVRNQRVLREMTPLADPKDLPELYEGTGFDGMNARNTAKATPNTLLQGATPARSVASSTPGSVMSGHSMATSIVLPTMRDQFGLNDALADDFSDYGGSVQNRKLAISQQLLALPEPEFTYDIAIPKGFSDIEPGDDESTVDALAGKPEDAAELIARQRRQAKEEEAAAMARRSTVLRRELPRPLIASREVEEALRRPSYDAARGGVGMDIMAASAAVNAEMVALINHDNYTYPFGERSVGMAPGELEPLSDSYLQKACEAVAEELASIDAVSPSNLEEYWQQAQQAQVYIPSRGEVGRPAGKVEALSSLSHQFAAIRSKIDAHSQRSREVEGRLKVLTDGYVMRNSRLNEAMLRAHESYTDSLRELRSFEYLRSLEALGAPKRIAQLRSETLQLEERERSMQQKYALLMQLMQSH